MSLQSLLKQTARLADYTKLEAYFDGKARLDALGINLPPQTRLLELVVDWPRITVESLAERLTVEGFSLANGEETAKQMWGWWKANDMGTLSNLLHIESFAQGLAYGIVGEDLLADGTPQFSVARTLGMSVRSDDITGRVAEAARRFVLDGEKWVAHYEKSPLGEVTVSYYGFAKTTNDWSAAHPTGGQAIVQTPFTQVPVVPYKNRARIGDRYGRSEMLDVIRYTDGAARSLTNMQVGQELLALPQRYLLGSSKESMRDPNGNPLTEWDAYIGHLLRGPADAKVGQLPGADLTQIHSTIRLYAQLVSGSTGIPLTSLGISAEANPASADALNAAANRHVKKAEFKQEMFGARHEEMMHRAYELVHGEPLENGWGLETLWRNASTPTLQAQVQSSVMLYSAGLIPAVVARDMVNLTPEQKRLAAEADLIDPVAMITAMGRGSDGVMGSAQPA